MLFETLSMSLFVGLLSYMLYTSSHKGGFETGKKTKGKTGHFAIDKWLAFGGGYYGTVALVKLIISEARQTYEFLTDWEEVLHYFSNFGLGTIISFFINQLKMFIKAIIWPVDYFGEYSFFELIILLVMTYGAYRWAQHLAEEQHLKSKKA